MRYSYEFKRKCIDMYRRGILPAIPDGISKHQFRHEIRKWIKIEEAQGSETLRHKSSNKIWTPEEKLVLVSKVIAGESNKSVAFNAGINDGMLSQWVRKYKIYGYNGLINKKKGRKPKDPDMKKVSIRKLKNQMNLSTKN